MPGPTYITKLSNAEHEAPEWQAAMEAPILVATLGGPMMLARIGMVPGLNRHHVREFNSDRKQKAEAEEGPIAQLAQASEAMMRTNRSLHTFVFAAPWIRPQGCFSVFDARSSAAIASFSHM